MELPIPNHQKKEMWKSHVDRSLKHEVSQAQYCREQGIKPSQLYYWRDKLNGRKGKTEPRKNGFVRVMVPSQLSHRIRLSLGLATVEIDGIVDVQWLATLLTQLNQANTDVINR